MKERKREREGEKERQTQREKERERERVWRIVKEVGVGLGERVCERDKNRESLREKNGFIKIEKNRE